MSNIKNKILIELLNKQKSDVKHDKKLNLSHINRICKNLNSSIFGDECSLWRGYVTKLKNNKDKYINFYFNGKKCALHRLLYLNYVGSLEHNEYLKYNCENKGLCCNINHYEKVVKNNNDHKKYLDSKKNVKNTSKKTMNNKSDKKFSDNQDKKIEVINMKDDEKSNNESSKQNTKKLIIIF